MKGFIEFVRKQGVVGLAIGFIIGVATAALVTSLTTDLINPIIGAIIGSANLDTLTFTVGDATFNYGHFISVLIDFLIILLVVYLGFKVLRLERLDLEEEENED